MLGASHGRLLRKVDTKSVRWHEPQKGATASRDSSGCSCIAWEVTQSFCGSGKHLYEHIYKAFFSTEPGSIPTGLPG